MQLATHIHTLLLQHDCVTIPGFGGMVAQHFRAEINPATSMLRPPSKRISFHKNLNANPHLLTNSVAQATQQSLKQAEASIAKTVSEWQTQLANGKSVKVTGVGRFYLDKENNVCFNQSLESNFDVDAFGLDTFRATVIKRETEIKEAVVTAITDTKKHRKSAAQLWRAAAVFTGIGLLLTVGYLKSDLNLKQSVFASFNPLHYARAIDQAPVAKTSLPVEITRAQPSEKTTVEATEKATKPASLATKKQPAVKTELPSATSGYHVIVGSFKEAENATELLQLLRGKGYNPVIINDKSSYTKVSIEGFRNRTQAVQAMRAYKLSVNKSAWIYKK